MPYLSVYVYSRAMYMTPPCYYNNHNIPINTVKNGVWGLIA